MDDMLSFHLWAIRYGDLQRPAVQDHEGHLTLASHTNAVPTPILLDALAESVVKLVQVCGSGEDFEIIVKPLRG